MCLRSNRCEDAPAIAPDHLSTDTDRKVAADSRRQVRRIVAQPVLACQKSQEWMPGVQFQTDEALARLAGDIANRILHPVGTAKMGPTNDPWAVVVPQLRGRGGDNLRVADASFRPTIPSGKTNSPILMIAE